MIDLRDYDVAQVGTQTTERWAAAKQAMDETPRCKNCKQETHPSYLARYNGYCLECSNAGADVKDAEIAKLVAERDAARQSRRRCICIMHSGWYLILEKRAEQAEAAVAAERTRGETWREALRVARQNMENCDRDAHRHDWADIPRIDTALKDTP